MRQTLEKKYMDALKRAGISEYDLRNSVNSG
jgi:hypothetical protein